jgi:PAS domain S-box-containing protein
MSIEERSAPRQATQADDVSLTANLGDPLPLAACQADAQDLPDRRESITAEPVERLVQELRAHEFELELQNEQLRLAQAELTASRERYMDLYDFAPVGYFTLDRHGSILEANLTGARLLGVERSTLVGGRFGHYVALADRDRFHFYCSQVGSAGGVLETEIRLIPRESPEFYARLEGARPRNAAGSGDRCMIAVSDITGSKRAEDALRQLHLLLETQVTHRTAQLHEANQRLSEELAERVRTEQALRESEERFRHMADTAPVMIWVTGPDRVVSFLNKTWLKFTGRTLDKDLQKAWTESVHPEDLRRCVDCYSSAYEQNRDFRLEYRLRRADGEYRWVLCSGTPRFAPGGAFAGYIGSDIDITDEKNAQAQAFERQKLESLGVLCSGIAHDFNNMLGSILAETEVQLAESVAESPSREGTEKIRAVAVRAAEIVRELMAYAGHESPVFGPVDLSSLVAEMLELLKISIHRGAELNLDLPANLPSVRANAAQIRQLMLNLVTNASEALATDAGVISVSLSTVRSDGELSDAEAGPSASGYVRLMVTDNGCGMTPEIQAKIFDPFFSTKFAGRGLGLGAVQGIVRHHGGTIRVSSVPGQGSRFEIFLPCLVEPDRQPAPPALRPSVAAAKGAVATILLVEDEETLSMAVSRMLRKKGYSVLEAADGLAAVDLFRANHHAIDLVLLDLTLPEMSGQQVLRELRRIQPNLKVILTTAYGREMALTSLGGLQPWLFLRKPYRFDELLKLFADLSLPG